MTGLNGRWPSFAGSYGRGTKPGVRAPRWGESEATARLVAAALAPPSCNQGRPPLKSLFPSGLPSMTQLFQPWGLGWPTLRAEGGGHRC